MPFGGNPRDEIEFRDLVIKPGDLFHITAECLCDVSGSEIRMTTTFGMEKARYHLV